MKDIGSRVGYTILWGKVRSTGPGCNVHLSSGTATSRNGGVLLGSRSAGHMRVGGCLLLCGGLCVLRGCGRVCPNTSYGHW